MDQEKKGLGIVEVVGYGACSMGALMFQASFVSYQLLAFLTNVSGFSTVVAATIFSFANLIKIITMAASGTLIDGVTFKSGKFRTWCLIGGFVSVASSLMFFKFDMAEAAYIVVFVALFVINQLGYNFMWTGSRALVGPMSSSSTDAMKLATAAQIGSSAAGIIYGIVAMPLMSAAPASQPYGRAMRIALSWGNGYGSIPQEKERRAFQNHIPLCSRCGMAVVLPQIFIFPTAWKSPFLVC